MESAPDDVSSRHLKPKNLAISLRKEGLSYSDILKKVFVAKSTLSLWLRSVGLSKKQKQTLTERKLIAIRKGGVKKREQRLRKIETIDKSTFCDIGQLGNRELWLAGIMLYWAEGEKQKETNVSVGIKFSNSDPEMLSFFIFWLKEYLKIIDDDIVLELYIHDNFKEIKDIFVEYWSNELGYPRNKFNKVYYKKNKVMTMRKNVNQNYHGQINVRVRRSTDLNRRIAGWIKGFNKQCPVV